MRAQPSTLEATLLARYGQGALRPLQASSSVRRVVEPGGLGLIAYADALGVRIALGDPIGPLADATAMMRWFVIASRAAGLLPAAYQLSEQGRLAAEAAGLVAIAIGREAVIDLAAFGLGGAARANLRHTVARARRGGCRAAWFPDGPDAAVRRALLDVDRAWSARRLRLGFSVGRFNPGAAGIATSIVTDAEGVPIAFATFCSTGTDGGRVLDLVRRVPGGTPGAAEFAVAAAAMRFAADGCAYLSLGLAPLGGLDRTAPRRLERTLAGTARLVRRWYDTEGLRHWKNKFAPSWQTRYLAAPSGLGLIRAGLALVALHMRPRNSLSPVEPRVPVRE